MSNKNILMCGLLLALMISSVAMAAGNSINDTFDSLANSKGGSGKAAGLDAFDDLASGKGGSDAGIGHGVDAGLQAIEANKAAKAAQAERLRRIRMEQEAQKQDEEMQRSCRCIFTTCLKIVDNSDPCKQFINYSSSSAYGEPYWACQREVRAKEQWKRAHAEEIAAQELKEWQAQKRVCEAWKAAGPKANSESFKAQLRQQDAAIASRQREADEAALQRDALISAEERAQLAKERAIYDAKNAKAAQEAAKAKSKADEQEAEFKTSCLADVDYSRCGCLKYYPIKNKGGVCRK